jgi:hypothetical protein
MQVSGRFREGKGEETNDGINQCMHGVGDDDDREDKESIRIERSKNREKIQAKVHKRRRWELF